MAPKPPQFKFPELSHLFYRQHPAQPAKRALYVSGFQYHDEPILLTEFGGVAYQKDQQSGWGYSTARDEQDFLKRFAEIMEAVLASPVLQGYCYTQLTDVEQETIVCSPTIANLKQIQQRLPAFSKWALPRPKV